MRSAPPALESVLWDRNVRWEANLFTLVTRNSGTLRWTDADGHIGHGGQTYVSGLILSVPRVRCTASLEVDEVEIQINQGALTVAGLPVAAAAASGLFDGAALYLDRLLSEGPGISHGVIRDFAGQVSTVEPSSTGVRMVAKSIVELLESTVPIRVIQHACPYRVGDTFCGATVLSDTRTTDTGCTTTTINVTAAITNATAGGVLTVGEESTTILTASGTTITLVDPLRSAPAAGVSVTATQGCDQTPQTCDSRFDNLLRFGGFPELPQEADPNLIRLDITTRNMGPLVPTGVSVSPWNRVSPGYYNPGTEGFGGR